jgi:SM-20-related protein
MNSELIASKLAETGWAHIPDFISRELALAILDEAQSMKASGLFKPAGVGRSSSIQESLRRDEILWLDEKSLTPSIASLWAQLESFRFEMNERLFLSLREFEAHLASYDAGAYYGKHVDRFRDDDRRTISMVLYLNPDWLEADGGLLKMSTDVGEQTFLPEAGSMVCFMSDRIEHEVTLSHRQRWSIAAWFKRGSQTGLP